MTFAECVQMTLMIIMAVLFGYGVVVVIFEWGIP